MKTYNIEFKTEQKFFTERKREIVAVIMFPDGKILVSTKEYYPDGVYRLATGGIKDGETPEEALKREIYEETGITEFASEKIAEIFYNIDGIDNKLKYESHIFLVKVEEQEIKVIDEDEKISDSKKVHMDEFKIMGEKFLNLGIDNIKEFNPAIVAWVDWGRFRKIAHDVVIELIK